MFYIRITSEYLMKTEWKFIISAMTSISVISLMSPLIEMEISSCFPTKIPVKGLN